MTTATISEAELRRRLIGCWLGKAVGGTLGMPYEGVRHTLDLTYYDPVPTEMIPNDDLDLQVVYAFLLERMESPRVDRHVLSEAWKHIGMSPDEYGIVKRNLALGLKAPTTGSYDNPFTRGMGAAIRTEIWACLAPGDPRRAMRYAYEDACMDHAGEGIYAAQYLAALQSLAFIEPDRETLLDAAAGYIPADSELAGAIDDTRAWWAETGDWKIVQGRLAETYLTDNFTDVVINLAYTVLGWLAGEDFGSAICIAVNCGQDTDCTGATLGALLGILDPDGIDTRWLKPIGRDLVLSPCITGVDHPATLDGFTDLVISLRERIADQTPDVTTSDDEPTDHLGLRVRMGSVAWPPSEAPAAQALEPAVLPGHYVQRGAETLVGDATAVAYRVHLDMPGRVHLMCNSRDPVRAWWNGQLVIDSDGGEAVPAFHRTRPEDQCVPIDAESGEHTLAVVFKHPDTERPLIWCVGISDNPSQPVDRDWLVGAFERVGRDA